MNHRGMLFVVAMCADAIFIYIHRSFVARQNFKHC